MRMEPSVELTEIYRPIRSQLRATEDFLSKQLVLADGLLGELTRYIGRMPGKRIRPALTLLSAGLVKTMGTVFGGTGLRPVPPKGSDPIIRLAAAVEMIHTATLLHDDVIDGASLRRGLSTLNAKWGDTLSVLSGDYLYSQAFCLLSGLQNPAVLTLMSDTARTVCEGEVAQIQHQHDWNLSPARYLKIIQWKTASLMGASVQAGALLAGASRSQAARLGAFGINFGMAFQIVDDTQDLIGDQVVLGKSLGTDLSEGNVTLPLIRLRESNQPEVVQQLAVCFNGNGHSPDKRLKAAEELRQYAIRLQIPQNCRRVAQRFLTKARAALEPFAPCRYRSSLLALTDFLLR